MDGLIPEQMIRALRAYLDFCYLVRREVIDERDLEQIENAYNRYRDEREIFRTSGVCPDGFSLPRQHSLPHYIHNVPRFGAPYGVDSSITESHHVKAVKKPYRKSNKFNALAQMLKNNERIDKLSGFRIVLSKWGKLAGSVLDSVAEESDDPMETEDDPDDATYIDYEPPQSLHDSYSDNHDDASATPPHSDNEDGDLGGGHGVPVRGDKQIESDAEDGANDAVDPEESDEEDPAQEGVWDGPYSDNEVVLARTAREFQVSPLYGYL